MPRICSVFYGIGEAYRFGFGQAWFYLESELSGGDGNVSIFGYLNK